MNKIVFGAAAVMTLAGLAILKCALDAADNLASDNTDWDRAAIEGDGDITLYATGWRA